MNIFEEFASKDELLKQLAEAIIETTTNDGETAYRLPNREAETLRAKYDAEVKNAKSQREKKQEAEAKLAELNALRDKELAELETLRKSNPSDLRETLQRYVDQTAESTAKIRALEKELVPLREENQRFREKETISKIETELVTQARKLNCCESALRDVKRLAPMFHVNDDGIIMTNDKQLVVEVLQNEIAQSPHWLNRSQGANSGAGTSAVSSEAKFREALKGNDFGAILANAPRSQVR